jgi:hypothetical protein
MVVSTKSDMFHYTKRLLLIFIFFSVCCFKYMITYLHADLCNRVFCGTSSFRYEGANFVRGVAFFWPAGTVQNYPTVPTLTSHYRYFLLLILHLTWTNKHSCNICVSNFMTLISYFI